MCRFSEPLNMERCFQIPAFVRIPENISYANAGSE
jgi:hypothetical protein